MQSSVQRSDKLARNAGRAPWQAPVPSFETGPAPVYTTKDVSTKKEKPYSFPIPAAHMDRVLRGARNYSQADRSDPHAYNRAMSYIRTGICNPWMDMKDVRKDAAFDAKQTLQERTLPGSGEKYNVVVFIDAVRP